MHRLEDEPSAATALAAAGLDDAAAARLGGASAPELHGLVAQAGGRWRLGEVRAVVRNPHVDAETLEALAAIKALSAIYEVRALLVRHRRTPPTVAMRFVNSLFWRDLLEIALDVQLLPGLRRLAEKYLLQRLPRLAPGERTTLARRAPPEVLSRLTFDPHPRVIAATLDNPLLTEERIQPMLTSARSTPRMLEAVARHPRWSSRYPVRVLLCRHPLAPSVLVLPLLDGLRRDDLEALAHGDAAFAVRHRAREILEERPQPGSLGGVEGLA
jgi:hypothetical protein